ncbi:nucleotidyltransferase domain-containing protein [Haloparvum sp. AD34]
MGTQTSDKEGKTPRISIDIPPRDARLFGSEALTSVLTFLSRHHEQSFSVSELAEAVEYSRKSVSNAVDVLASNDLVVDKQANRRRAIRIQPDRLFLPDDPFFQIPQPKFRKPAREATDKIVTQLENVLAVVVYGSVARGEADRRSDIDLWVLVENDRMAQQREANQIRKGIEDERFGEQAERYNFDIDVEVLSAIPNYTESICDILSEGITVYQEDEFETVENIVFHGGSNE